MGDPRALSAHQHRALQAGGRWFEPGTAHGTESGFGLGTAAPHSEGC